MPASGAGELTLRGAVWQPPLAALEDVPLHAEQRHPALDARRRSRELSSFDMHGRGDGHDGERQVRLRRRSGASTLDLRMTITPLPGSPPELRRLLDGLPQRPDGVHDFLVTGTIDAPAVSPP